MSSVTPTPSAGATSVCMERDERMFDYFDLINDFFRTSEGMDTFFRYYSSASDAASIRTSRSVTFITRCNFGRASITRASSAPLIRCLLETKAAVLIRSCQVFLKEVRINQFRRPAIRFCSFANFRERGLFYQRIWLDYFTFRFFIIGRYGRFLALIIIRHGGNEDLHTKVHISMVVRVFTRWHAIYSNAYEGFNLFAFSIGLMRHDTRKTSFITNMVRGVYFLIPSRRVFCLGFSFYSLFRRISSGNMRVGIIMSIAFARRSSIFQVRYGI